MGKVIQIKEFNNQDVVKTIKFEKIEFGSKRVTKNLVRSIHQT